MEIWMILKIKIDRILYLEEGMEDIMTNTKEYNKQSMKQEFLQDKVQMTQLPSIQSKRFHC